MQFQSEIYHPNGEVFTTYFRSVLTLFLFFLSVEENGNVCISILHEPGEDKWGYEKPEERWLPIHTVETILISVISMLADPNDESPANVDAAVSLQNHASWSEVLVEDLPWLFFS